MTSADHGQQNYYWEDDRLEYDQMVDGDWIDDEWEDGMRVGAAAPTGWSSCTEIVHSRRALQGVLAGWRLIPPHAKILPHAWAINPWHCAVHQVPGSAQLL